MNYSEELLYIFFCITTFILGLISGCIALSESIEIQEVVETEKGYYITINNEIYYKEVEKDVKD